MGWKLAEVALDNMPPDLTSGERCAVTAIAWSIIDETGEGWITGEKLLRRSGLSERGLRKALERLAERGFELRVALGQGDDGRPVYAHRGKARHFRFPVEWRSADPVDNPEEGGTPVPATAEKGGTPVPERRYPSTGKAVPQYPPRGYGGKGGSTRARGWPSTARPPIGTPHDSTCLCHGSGREEDQDGIPTGRPCRVGHLQVVNG